MSHLLFSLTDEISLFDCNTISISLYLDFTPQDVPGTRRLFRYSKFHLIITVIRLRCLVAAVSVFSVFEITITKKVSTADIIS